MLISYQPDKEGPRGFRLFERRIGRVATLSLLWILLSSCDQFDLKNSPPLSFSSLALQECGFVINARGQLVSWKNQVPISYRLSRRVPADWKVAIKNAASVWMSSSGRPLIRILDPVSESENPSNDRQNIIYLSESGELKSQEQAQTIVRWVGDRIQDADVLINNRDFTFFTYGDGEWGRVHLESLLVHEFGHALGLRHTTEPTSLMYPQLSYFQIRTVPVAGDLKSVRCEYL
jgi:hypothetical protein